MSKEMHEVVEVTVRVRIIYEDSITRKAVLRELREEFETCSVNAGSWGFERIGRRARVNPISKKR